jgi:hypothetical protein
MFLLVFPLVQGRPLGWPVWTLVMPACSLLVFAVFGVLQLRRKRSGRSPLVELGVLAKRSYASGTVFVLVFFGAVGGFALAVGMLLQIGLGYTPIHASLTTAVWAVGAFLGTGLSAGLAPKLGRTILHLGLTLMAIGMAGAYLVLAHTHAGLSGWILAGPLLAFGIGMGMIFRAAASRRAERCPRARGRAAGDPGTVPGLPARPGERGRSLGRPGELPYRPRCHGPGGHQGPGRGRGADPPARLAASGRDHRPGLDRPDRPGLRDRLPAPPESPGPGVPGSGDRTRRRRAHPHMTQRSLSRDAVTRRSRHPGFGSPARPPGSLRGAQVCLHHEILIGGEGRGPGMQPADEDTRADPCQVAGSDSAPLPDPMGDRASRLATALLLTFLAGGFVLPTLGAVNMHLGASRVLGIAGAKALIISLQLVHSLPRLRQVRARYWKWTFTVQALLSFLPQFAIGSWAIGGGYLAGSALLLFRRSVASTCFGLILATEIAIAAATGGTPSWIITQVMDGSVIIALATYGLTRLTEVITELRATRTALAQSTAREARLRAARDVFGALGARLSSLARSAEQARLYVAAQPGRAGQMVAELGADARQALTQARTTSSAFREVNGRVSRSSGPLFRNRSWPP